MDTVNMRAIYTFLFVAVSGLIFLLIYLDLQLQHQFICEYSNIKASWVPPV